MLVTPNFHFTGDCISAIELYKQALCAKVLSLLTNREADPADYQSDPQYNELVYHGELMIGGTRVFMSDIVGDANHIPGNSLSLVITFGSAEEVQKAFHLMKQDAVILSPMHSTSYSSCFVSFIDRYGIRWELMTEQIEK